MSPIATLSVTAFIAAASAGHDASVTLPFGQVHGNALMASREFLGIPFASAQRFAAPAPWDEPYPSGELDARSYTVQCMQAPSASTVPMSEDCLHLNVYTPLPVHGHEDSWPVMLWIHGGGLSIGTAMDPTFNGSRLVARQDVVLVAVNYRLNALGFAPVRMSDGSVAANRGFLDQRESMAWVRTHISAFGGDHSSITIFGESAGAKSVHSHVVMPGSAGLFDRAIAESSGIAAYVTVEQGLASSDELAKAVNCHDASDLKCLKEADAAQLVANFSQVDPTVVGDEIMSLPPLELIQTGRFNNVPVLTSVNANEGHLFILPIPFTASYEVSRCAIAKHFPEKEAQEQIMDLYPGTDLSWADNRYVISDLLSDMRWRCGDRLFMQTLADAGAQVWMANFRRHRSCSAGYTKLPGVPHASEIPYVFGNAEDLLEMTNATCHETLMDHALSEKVGSIWADFARNGLAAWPQFSAETEQILKIDVGLLTRMETDAGYRRTECQALDAIGYAASANISMNLIYELIACELKPPTVV